MLENRGVHSAGRKRMMEEFRRRRGGGAGGGPSGGRSTPGGTGNRVGRVLRGKGQLTGKYPDGLADAIRTSARDLGISERDLATAISYETGGTLDPWKKGPTTKWGTHRGLIQWGEPQARKYGVTKDTPVGDQMKAVTRYLRDAGVTPGMGLAEVYSAINAGTVGRMGASDRPGYTVRRHVEEMRGPHGRRADRLLGTPPTAPSQADDAGFAADFKRRATEADERRKILEPSPASSLMKSLRAGGYGGAPNLDVKGGVNIMIDRASPDARVRAEASGDLFREIKQTRGRMMPEAN